jgi:hypothetical protein
MFNCGVSLRYAFRVPSHGWENEAQRAKSQSKLTVLGGSPVFQGSVGVPPALKMEKIMEPRKNVNGREMRRGINIYREDWK